MEGGNQFSIKPQALGSFHGLAPNIDNSVWSTNDINGQFRKKQPVPNTLSPIIMVQWKWTYVPLVVTMWHHLNIQPFSMEPWLLKLFWETKNSPSQTFLFFSQEISLPKRKSLRICAIAAEASSQDQGWWSWKAILYGGTNFPMKKRGEKRGGVGWLGGLESFHEKMPLCRLSAYRFSVLTWMDFRDDTERKKPPIWGFFWVEIILE